jgi:hypothetical protein
VYEHLDRLEREVAGPASIPVYRVSSGNIRDDALNPAKRFASMPLWRPQVQDYRRAVATELEGSAGLLDQCAPSSSKVLGPGLLAQTPGSR